MYTFNIILKDYVNLINDTSLSIGTIFYLLVNLCMMLLISQQEDSNQTSEALIYTLEQALAILDGPQNERLEKTKAFLTICQEQLGHKLQLLIYVQSLLVTVGAITSRKEEDIQDLNILEWVIAFLSSDLKNK